MKRYILRMTAALTLIFCIGTGPSPISCEKNYWRFVESQFRRGMETDAIVGGVCAVFGNRNSIAGVCAGWANREQEIPVNEATIFCWGSVTKLFTCIAVMQLHSRGRLDIDDRLVLYIPEIRKIRNTRGDPLYITLRMLMNHSSGLPSESFILPLSWHENWPNWQQIESMLNFFEMKSKPGSQYRYSNLGILLLGKVIELVTGDDYEVYIDKNIFKPLQMYESYFDVTPYHLKRLKAQGYYKRENRTWRCYHPDIDQGFTTSNGGLKSSLRDVKRFVCFLLGSDDQAVQAEFNRVLSRDCLTGMWRPCIETKEGEGLFMGLGFYVILYRDGVFIGHSGGANGFVSNLTIHPASGKGFVAVGNTDNFGALMRKTRSAFMDAMTDPEVP